MTSIRIITLALYLCLVAGCAVRENVDDTITITSYDGVSLIHPLAAYELAEKTAFTLSGRYQATPVALIQAPGLFGEQLLAGMRDQGMQLAPARDAIKIGYVLDMVQGEKKPTGYLQVRSSDGGQFGQMFTFGPGGELVTASTLTQSEPFFSVAPSTAPTAAGLMATQTSHEWRIAPGSLKKQLQEWCDLAGYQLVWKADHDYTMESTAIFRDSFVGAVKRLLTYMHNNGNPLRASIFEDNQVVEVMED